MFSSRIFKIIFLVAAVSLQPACEELTDDLNPSGQDQREDVQVGITGTGVGQYVPDFTLKDTLNNDRVLSTEYTGVDAVVLYFTMWCPICDSHMSYMRQVIVPAYPNVNFLFVDYVSGSVTSSRSSQVANGYTDFDVLVDTDQAVLDLFNATMGTTVVIKNDSTVMMNEDFKDGSKLATVLSALP